MARAVKPRRGRPPRAGAVSGEMIKLRVTTDERRSWEQRAADDDKTLSEWIRSRCNE